MKWLYLLIAVFSALTICFISKENRESKMVIPIILEFLVVIFSIILLFK